MGYLAISSSMAVYRGVRPFFLIAKINLMSHLQESPPKNKKRRTLKDPPWERLVRRGSSVPANLFPLSGMRFDGDDLFPLLSFCHFSYDLWSKINRSTPCPDRLGLSVFTRPDKGMVVRFSQQLHFVTKFIPHLKTASYG